MSQKQTASIDALKFEEIELGDFTIWNFQEMGDLVATFVGEWTPEEGCPLDKPVLKFKEFGTGSTVVLPQHYQLMKTLVHNQSETEIYFEREPVFKIQRLADKVLKNGDTIANYKIFTAYQK